MKYINGRFYLEPISAHIDVTNKCNLKCIYCFYYEDPYVQLPDRDPSKDEILDWMEQLAEIGVKFLTFSGGEAFMRPDFLEILSSETSENFWKVILTNGILLDEQTVEELENVPKLLELRVSLDGFDANKKVRGVDAKVIIQNIDLIGKMTDLAVHINTMITTENLHELEKMYEWIEQHEAISGWAIDLPIVRGRYISAMNALRPSWSEMAPVLKRLILRYIDERPPFKLAIFSIFRESLLYPNKIKDRIYSFDLESHPCSYLPSVTIRTDGSVTLCPSLPFSIGNIRERPLRDILESPDPGSERVLRIRIRDIKKCSNCRYVKICGAGCRANAFLETGKLIEVDSITCKMMEFFESEILPHLPRKSRELIGEYLT
ncbi:hypothetical protein DRN38_00640 [Thermococci archaeon]|nr:MAG: hypothetical protein DRN32_00245 [Thermococci archaeon]RLF82222.1 MAG: hypothetical protein DRN38_00640 [Thermococci archaeon]